MYKPHRKPWPKSKTSDISKQSPSPLHHTFLLGRARFTAQPLSALVLAEGRSLEKNSTFRAGHYKNLIETVNLAKKVSGTQGTEAGAGLR